MIWATRAIPTIRTCLFLITASSSSAVIPFKQHLSPIAQFSLVITSLCFTFHHVPFKLRSPSGYPSEKPTNDPNPMDRISPQSVDLFSQALSARTPQELATADESTPTEEYWATREVSDSDNGPPIAMFAPLASPAPTAPVAVATTAPFTVQARLPFSPAHPAP
jgi:hypothetical protein